MSDLDRCGECGHYRGNHTDTGCSKYDCDCRRDKTLAAPGETPPLQKPDHVEGSTIQERFESFHALNPWVYAEYERLTQQWVDSGRTRLGIGMLTEVLRWQYGRRTVGDVFKISNDYRSRYVRLLLARHPEWEDVFVLRELTAP